MVAESLTVALVCDTVTPTLGLFIINENSFCAAPDCVMETLFELVGTVKST